MADTNVKNYDPGSYPDDDDGFNGGSGRPARGSYLTWNLEWRDSDGLPPPSPLVVIKIDEIVRRWRDHKPEDITAKPLPDVDDLNSSVPVSEWELGVDKKPRPPYEHTVVVRLVNPATGSLYTYASATVGGHIAYEDLQQSVKVMRMLKGAPVVPQGELSAKPFKTGYGLKTRPHFEITGWVTPGGNASLPAVAPPLQLPSAAALSEPAASEPEAAVVEHVPIAETSPPRGARGRIAVTSGKQGGKSKAHADDLEKRRPDLKPDPSDDIPF
jgi:hypothetical protein